MTSYLEIFLYSDEKFNTVEEHPLALDRFEEFLKTKGEFHTPTHPKEISLLGGLRLLVQQNAKHPEAFSPLVISLKKEEYITMVEAFHLPYRAIESSSVVGPFFWSTVESRGGKKFLQIVFRRTGMRKKGRTRGWELILSYDFNTAITYGFYKGTPLSDIVESIKQLKACYFMAGHPMLLPMTILGRILSFNLDIKQREMREWLTRLEKAVSMRAEIEEREAYVKNGVVDLDVVSVNRDLVDCHAKTLKHVPGPYFDIIKHCKETLNTYKTFRPIGQIDAKMNEIQDNMISRLEFYERKLQGVEYFAKDTVQRLDVQRTALNTIIAQEESRLNFGIAGDSKKLAQASKRDATSMKTLALLGTVFLPGSYIASILSTTFFNFQNAPGTSAVSSRFWIYWTVTIPVTILIVGLWLFWERRRERRYAEED